MRFLLLAMLVFAGCNQPYCGDPAPLGEAVCDGDCVSVCAAGNLRWLCDNDGCRVVDDYGDVSAPLCTPDGDAECVPRSDGADGFVYPAPFCFCEPMPAD